ncbi:hypothetical protein CONPUDRAFT_168452 [Coniophora puteana RWD-64-598 SS2]|uniref:Uncharacterized protein n=1 Tax=Coniophora puteana (strain RWD-64-598) TaxID=741705 RepID=A0A5M3MDB9_CONPW|nr:uncharacterized protein CONPUDRAFT_168452 [Coniophora puteana RWD-64-598 SS2]EIW76625.1 hypothetical protein CONPUDRAFT_168452 [Coniophora puteana RWD-64-598 SS2]
MLMLGDQRQRKALADQLVAHNIIGTCLSYVRREHFSLRQKAADLLRALTTDYVLTGKLSPTVASDLFEALCSMSLEYPERWSEYFAGKKTRFECQLHSKLEGASDDAKKGSKVGAYVFGLAQENALRASHGLTMLGAPAPQKFCLEMLKRRPHIIDLLFDCAILQRSPAFPHAQVNPMALEALCILFQWPRFTVPGVSPSTDRALLISDTKSLSQALQILTTRKGWASNLVETWTHNEEEKWSLYKVEAMCKSMVEEYGPNQQPAEDAYRQATLHRDKSRIYTLRLIITLTHFSESCGVTNAELMSFLRIAYEASHKISESPWDVNGPRAEGSSTAEALPVWHDRCDPPPIFAETIRVFVSEQHIGPTALVRLLAVLAQRKALSGIQTLKKPPPGLSQTTTLAHVQQITHPDVIRRIIAISNGRLDRSLESGRLLMTQDPRKSPEEQPFPHDYICVADDLPKEESACSGFLNAAELAAALVALDTHTGGAYAPEICGARKKLVIALGNAAEMALRLAKYRYAYSYALGAVTSAENVPLEANLSPEVVVKNRRRLEVAKGKLDGAL